MGVKIKERYPGEYWVYIYHKGKQRAKKIGNSEELALEVAEKIKAKLVLGDFKIEKTSGPRFTEYAKKWHALPHDWKQSTRSIYGENLKRYIYPAFKNRRIGDIDKGDLQQLFDRLAIKGLSAGTICNVRVVLRGIFDHAVDGGLIEHNLLRDYKSKRKKRPKIHNTLDNEKEVPLLLQKAKEMYSGRYYPLIYAALRTGARIGELLALQWEDVNFDSQMILVRRNYDYKNDLMTTTKTDRQRWVDMTDELIDILKEYRLDQKKTALQHGREFSGFVFINKTGEPIQIETFRAALNKMLNKAGLKQVRIHDLRHSYATHRAALGHDIRDISYQMGHSSLSITNDLYTDWKPGHFKHQVNELEKLGVLTHTCVERIEN